MRLNIAIVPAGQWGTALAVPFSRGGHSVKLYFRRGGDAEYFNARKENRRRLAGVVLPPDVSATDDLAKAVGDADLVVLAPASGGLRPVVRKLAPLIPPHAVIVSAVKALFPEEPRLVSGVIAQELEAVKAGSRDGSRGGVRDGFRGGVRDGFRGGARDGFRGGARDGSQGDSRGGSTLEARVAETGAGAKDGDVARRIAVVSGPNFAVEVARELPAGTVVASASAETARFVQSALMTDRFRVWTSTDVIGVQLGGALKNVIAIAAGISDGLGMGHNARATVITRGVAEITRLGVALGADPMTFAGVSGIGDLMLTCTGDLSRNRRAGLAIARGEAVDPNTTVEGVPTTKAAYALARRLGIDMPITEVVYQILFRNLSPAEGLERLMTRQPTSEQRLPK